MPDAIYLLLLPTQLSVFNPSKNIFVVLPSSPVLSKGLPELCLDIQTNRQTPKQRLLLVIQFYPELWKNRKNLTNVVF